MVSKAEPEAKVQAWLPWQLCEAFNCRILHGRYAANIHTYYY